MQLHKNNLLNMKSSITQFYNNNKNAKFGPTSQSTTKHQMLWATNLCQSRQFYTSASGDAWNILKVCLLLLYCFSFYFFVDLQLFFTLYNSTKTFHMKVKQRICPACRTRACAAISLVIPLLTYAFFIILSFFLF